MESHQLINQDSGNTEYYTPIEIVEAARQAMGGIDLDPASSGAANERVKAGTIYTATENGLLQPWFGRVWLNHPFGRESNPRWIGTLTGASDSGRVEQFCCITFACTSESWFAPLHRYWQCFPFRRTNYLLPDGTVKRGVTKGSVITYGGWDVEGFKGAFSKIGFIRPPAVEF